MTKYYILLLTLWTSTSNLATKTLAQAANPLFGNEWINYNQTYLKIKIVKEGIYRINQNQLLAAGMPPSLNPKHIQLFAAGKEQFIYLKGEADNVFDPSDYIDFYGKPNDGKADSNLYINKNDIRQQFISLYTDTAFYYLTWNTQNTLGKRMVDANGSTIGGTPEANYEEEIVLAFKNTYSKGEPANDGVGRSWRSEQNNGEMPSGTIFDLGGKIEYNIPTKNVFRNGTTTNAKLKIMLLGRNNPVDNNNTVPPLNHHLQIYIGQNELNLNLLEDTLYRGFATCEFKKSVALNQLTDTTTLIQFKSINDINLKTDRQSVSNIVFQYPRTFELDNQSTRKLTFTGQNGQIAYLRFPNYNPSKSQPILYDFTTQKRITGRIQNGAFEVMVANGGLKKQLYLNDETQTLSVTLQNTTFTPLNAASQNYTYLIVTAQTLLQSANAYENYRKSPTGGNWKVLTITTEQLYDQFFYGLHSPLAIRNFLAYLFATQTQKPKELLLLGKGQTIERIRTNYAKDLVPTVGVPGSDNMLSYNTFNNNTFFPSISIGRVSAINNQQVNIYLDKVIEYESVPKGQKWQKNVFLVTGAQTVSEYENFKIHMRTFANYVKNPQYGAYILQYDKDATRPAVKPTEILVDKINNGIGMYNYFGHGSSTVIAVEPGIPSDYNNAGKYPVFFFSGCNIGNAFEETSLGEDFLYQLPRRGAIAWIAQTSLGFESQLARISNAFGENISIKHYNESLGFIVKESLTDLSVADDLSILHIQQNLYQGDPAIKLYTYSQPDYEVKRQNIFITPENMTALSDSFYVAIAVNNLGRATNDTTDISIKRTFPDGSIINYPLRKFKPIYNTDTLYYLVKSRDLKTRGTNRFEITTDATNRIAEFNETNNTDVFDYFVPSNAVNLLLPLDYGIVPTTTPELVFQNSNLFTNSQTYLYEIDTTAKFNSVWKQTGSIQASSSLVKLNPNLLATDSVVYYWRVRLNLPASEGGVWESRSFTRIAGVPDGWNQSKPTQFTKTGFDFIILDSLQNDPSDKNVFKFPTFTQKIKIESHSFFGPSSIRFEQGVISGGTCGNMGCVTVKHRILKPVLEPPATVDCQGRNPRSPAFDLTTTLGRTKFKNYLRAIPQFNFFGFYAIGVATQALKLDSIPLYLYQFGVDTTFIRTINTNQVGMAFVGQKGIRAGALMDTVLGPRGSAVVETDLLGRWKRGTYISETVGPAKTWKEASYQFTISKRPSQDSLGMSIIGIDKNRNETVLIANAGIFNNRINLSTINAQTYPYLKFRAITEDSVSRIPPQLKRWTIAYDAVPEGALVVDSDYRFYADTLSEGDTVLMRVKYINLSPIGMDSLMVRTTFADNSRGVLSSTKKLAPLPARQSVLLNASALTVGKSGNNTLSLLVNPEFNQPEQTLANNTIKQTVYVKQDPYSPVLDVVVDNRTIFDEEIVSPNPIILMTLRDENRLLKTADTSYFTVKFGLRDDATLRRIYFTDSRLEFLGLADGKTKARFSPKNLPDGLYKLSIEAKDVTGNGAGTQPYEITFKVINESAISNIYPYPNPFTTKMKFVFTITGDKLPDYIKISIYTITGRLVREVTKDELGNLHIGNNISDFSWDGTDQFGDQLAKGVYFYKVDISSEGNKFKTMSVAPDNKPGLEDGFFKNNIGKIYLMR